MPVSPKPLQYGQPDFDVPKHRALHNQTPRVIPAASLVGGIPAENSPFILQAGTNVVNFVGGNGNFLFPTPFVHGTLSIVVSNGDSGSSNFAVFSTNATTISGTNIVAVNSTTAAGISGFIRINWIAIGW